ncbi:MAG: TonB-dependent receptor, partial [Myxococcaceae bacterium]|nr:TonB-dependent receptor [Myxococcaceae bacterium]
MSITRGLRNTGVVLALVAIPSASALAQQGLGTIVGTVTDAATKKPVGDVVVTATAPQLPGEQIVVSDAQGQFRIPQLPAGQYTLRFEKESFRPFSRSDIPLRIDTTVRVNTELLPDTAGSEDIVVVGKAPTIDVGSTNVGTNIGGDFIRNIAVNRPSGRGGAARSFESLAEVAPGTNSDDYGVSMSGTTSPENGFVVDGLSVNDPAFGLLGNPLSVEFVQEVNVISGGYMPEYGRSTGGIMNVVTKRGSNEFRGSIFANWAPGALQSQPKAVESAGGTLNVTNRMWQMGDVGFELGGPIMKDKLWFYAGMAPSFQRNQLTRTISADGTVVDAATIQRFADQRTLQFIGKLTYAINQDHSLDVSVTGAPMASGGGDSYAFDTQSGAIRGGTLAGTDNALASTVRATPIDVALKMSNAFMDKR